MNIFETIAAEIADLKARDDFDVRNATTYLVPDFPANEKNLRYAVAATSDAAVPEDILSALRIDTELGAYWIYQGKAGTKVSGEFVLCSPLVFMMESRLDEAFFDEPYDGIDLRETRSIDYAAYSGRGIHALLRVQKDRLIDNVLLFDGRHVYAMGLAYLDYVEMVRLTRGIAYWQFLFCQGADIGAPRIETIRQGLELLAATFPDEDYSDLMLRLERLRT
ncbi:hypothetical protein OIU34_07380 [Pararhizobium sp. BT-229]|uniref:hypothetical protein n=1 Tax=Pararhizobium sp. BT-229 TaxID=2986923 RepID=UPI0021F6CAA9|nr:hypothetical protein [Pararhizobium sp. BT-229]MCV9961722.1 hypothetical protein [Pararhizobium sp. BT-229]